MHEVAHISYHDHFNKYIQCETYQKNSKRKNKYERQHIFVRIKRNGREMKKKVNKETLYVTYSIR